MITVETLKTKRIGRTTVTVDVVDFCEGSHWLQDLYTGTDQHDAGTTIKVPDHLWRGTCSYRYYIGQTKPSELAREYAAQGRDNPSGEAYDSLQRELAHYLQASDCAIRVRVEKAGVLLGESLSCSIDLSPENPWSEDYWKTYGMDVVKDAIDLARDTLAKLCK